MRDTQKIFDTWLIAGISHLTLLRLTMKRVQHGITQKGLRSLVEVAISRHVLALMYCYQFTNMNVKLFLRVHKINKHFAPPPQASL